jgi:HemY protein
MRGLFWILALFASAVGLSLVARYNDGYVLLFIAPKRIELSLTLFAVLQVAAFVILYFFVRAASYTLRLPDIVREFRARRTQARARHALLDAVVGLYEGRYARAERAAREAFKSGEDGGLAALVGARAAHMLNQRPMRDQWLDHATGLAQDKGARPLLHAVLMTRAELLADEHRDAEALAVLVELNKSGARHIAAQRLALKSMTRVGAWEEALKTARQLEEHRAIHPAVMERTRELAYAGLFASTDQAVLRERLRRVPRNERRMVPVARTTARSLIAAGMAAEAREIIETALDEQWDDVLASLYADCGRADPEAAIGPFLERCEVWRVRHPSEPSLLLALGRLCAVAGLWGKAQEYLELAIALRPEGRAHVELARVFEASGRTVDANRHYRLAATLAFNS